jgi:hypothetical protein
MKNILMTHYTDDIVKRCHQYELKNELTLWVNLINGNIRTPNELRNSKYYPCLVELVANQVDKLDKEQTDSLWIQTDIASDYIYPGFAPPNYDYDSYSGNKKNDVVSQIIDLITVDVICYSAIQHGEDHIEKQ